MEKRVLTKKEVDFEIAQLKAIWEIEGMEISPEEEAVARKFLRGEITREEFKAKYLS